MNIIKCLQDYKRKLINLGQNPKQKKFIEDSFSRWYINAKKDDLAIVENIIHTDGVVDLKFANDSHKLNFNIPNIQNQSDTIYDEYVKCYESLKDIGEEPIFEYIPNVINDKQEARLKKLYSLASGNELKLADELKSTQLGRPISDSANELSKYEATRNKLIALYNFIGTNNMHLSIPPIFKGVELFGSPLNTHNDKYCSPFEIEKQFGSSGSFFEYTFDKKKGGAGDGIYLCNPPFDEKLIKAMAEYLITQLDETSQKVMIIITIPIWDSKSQKQFKIKDYGMDFEGFDILINSKYRVYHKMLNKNTYKYYNYYTSKKAPASDTHFIILSNYDKVPKTAKNWNGFANNTFLNKWQKFSMQK